MNTQGINTQQTSGTQVPPAFNIETLTAAATPQQWEGLSFDELRQQRAKALVLREVERLKLKQMVDNQRAAVSENGIRSLLFSNSAVSGLKTADYVLMAFKVAKFIYKLSNKRRR